MFFLSFYTQFMRGINDLSIFVMEFLAAVMRGATCLSRMRLLFLRHDLLDDIIGARLPAGFMD